ncbi:hypothetical protein J3F80_002091 [Coemansia sp. RSA 2526]|nr:hypothetical protein J3F80_002091 [Coemansia sp. RSA 2526]
MSPEDLEKIVFNDYGLLVPTANLIMPFICAESPLRLHSKTITAKLSEDQLDLLRSSVDDPEKGKYGVHLFISNYASFCIERRLNQNARARLYMPQQLKIKVNGAYESSLLQPTEMRGRPIDLTQLFQVTSEVANRVDINYISNAPLLAVLTLTIQHTPQSMAGKIRKTNLETIDKVRQQFFGKQSDDDDVIAEGALVNLKCPLGLCRIKVPCRSKQCQHSQCFDCATFLQFYNMTTGWKCPVCSVGIKSWNELIVDGYFEDILLKTSENDEQVFVEPNGDWKLKQDATIMGGTVGKISGRPLDVDEEEDPIDLSDSSDAGNQNSGRHKRRRTDFVDLTMDSDSDDAGEEDLQPMTQEEIEMINALEADAGSAIGSSGTTTSASSQLTPHQAATPTVPLVRHQVKYDQLHHARRAHVLRRWFSETGSGSRLTRPASGTIPQPPEPINLALPSSAEPFIKYSDAFVDRGYTKSDIFLHPDFISDDEHDLLVRSCNKKLKRLANTYEMGHFDKRINNYRECSVSAWLPHKRGVAGRVSQAMDRAVDPDPVDLPDRASNGKSAGWTTVGKYDGQIRHILDRVWDLFPASFTWLPPHILDLHEDGEILPHVDNPEYSGFVVGGLCLLGPAVSTFKHVDDPSVRVDVLLSPKSLYFMTNRIRYQFTHEITVDPSQRAWMGQPVARARRISLMFRDAKEPKGGWSSLVSAAIPSF